MDPFDPGGVHADGWLRHAGRTYISVKNEKLSPNKRITCELKRGEGGKRARAPIY